jgi:short-subunit dehydrogenase
MKKRFSKYPKDQLTAWLSKGESTLFRTRNNTRAVLITGASSGIGEAFAWRFAALGFNLIITGRNINKLENIASELRTRFSIKVETLIAELSSEKDLNNLLRVIKQHNDISILVNNAGFGSGEQFCKNKIGCHLQMIRVHVVACLKQIHAVLPQMLHRQEGVIINVSSMAAFIPAPGSSIYSATKLFLSSFSESLALELKGTGIVVKCLCPGFTRTGFHNNLSLKNRSCSNRFPCWMKAESVVETCLRSLSKSTIICVLGIFNRLVLHFISLLPRRLYYGIINTIA